MARMFRNNRPIGGTLFQGSRDSAHPHLSHGPIIPLEQPTLLERLLGRR